MIDLGGTIREFTPAQTLARLNPLLLKTFGITRVADVTGLDNIGIPVCAAIRPNSKALANSQGKGITLELAMISAIMESVEGWHAENMQVKPHLASYNELLKAGQTIELGHLFSGYISYTDAADRKIAWCKTRDLISGTDIYAPYSMLSLDSTRYISGKELFASTSNGLASGNTYEEALCHALFEAIERDATSKVDDLSDEELAPRRVKIASIDSPHNQALIKKIQTAGYELYVWDITSEFGIPAYSAYIDDKKHIRGLGVFAGYGAHLSKEVALSRAITEAVQSRLTYISGARDDVSEALYKKNKEHANYSSLETIDYSATKSLVLPASFADCAELVIEKLKQQGIKHILVFDHTRKELGIAVVHVLLPDLKFDWRKHRMVI